MSYKSFFKNNRKALTIGFIASFMLLLISCNVQTRLGHNSSNNSTKPNNSNTNSDAINYHGQATLYSEQAVPSRFSSYLQLAQFYHQGQDVLLTNRADNKELKGYIYQPQNYYTYAISTKKLSKLTTKDGKALLGCSIFHEKGAVMSQDGTHLYFVAPNTQVSALYPSNAGFTIAEYNMTTKEVTPLITTQAQFGKQKYLNYYKQPKFSYEVWKHLIGFSPNQGKTPDEKVALALSPDQKTLYFVAWKSSVDMHPINDDVGVFAMDLTQKNHPIRLLGLSAVDIKKLNDSSDNSGVWLTLSPDGQFLVLSSDSTSMNFKAEPNGFIIMKTSGISASDNFDMDKTPYLFQGNNPSGTYYRFLGFDPKDSQKFFVSLINDNNKTISIEQGHVGSSQLKTIVENQKQIMSVNIPQTNGQAALFVDPTTQKFSLFDFNNPNQLIQLKDFPKLRKSIVSKTNSNIRYQMIDGRYIVFTDEYAAMESSNMYIYQFSLKKVKNV